jgi:hypothetical protein
MKAYLFGWNPVKFKWEDIDDDIQKLHTEGKLEEDWSVASHKTIKPGDRAYVVRVGVEPKGIFASGYISSEPFLASRKGRIYHPNPRYPQNRQPYRTNLDSAGIRHIHKA